MPVRALPPKPDLDHLKYQAKDLLRDHARHNLGAAQRIREFHPRFASATDAEIFAAHLKLSDAQLAIARESGFPSWASLKRHIEDPALSGQMNRPYHERIKDDLFRRGVELLDAGDVAGLRAHLLQHPNLARQHIVFEGGNYFQNPTLLEFIAENPIRHGTLPHNIAQVARVILDAGPEQSALNEALALVVTGSVPRECGVQVPLIDLLCDYGAHPDSAIHAALQGGFEAVNALIRRGASMDLPVAAGLGRLEDARRLLPADCCPPPEAATAIWRLRWHRSLVTSKSLVYCWARAKTRTGITRSAATLIRHLCIRPRWPAISKLSAYSSNAAQD